MFCHRSLCLQDANDRVIRSGSTNVVWCWHSEVPQWENKVLVLEPHDSDDTGSAILDFFSGQQVLFPLGLRYVAFIARCCNGLGTILWEKMEKNQCFAVCKTTSTFIHPQVSVFGWQSYGTWDRHCSGFFPLPNLESFTVSIFYLQPTVPSPPPPPPPASPVPPPSVGSSKFSQGDFTLEWKLGLDSITFTASKATPGPAACDMGGAAPTRQELRAFRDVDCEGGGFMGPAASHSSLHPYRVPGHWLL